ncbi:acidic mammalian chitinase-like [Ochlerotatus camptorhynchus]|uniref:acidic mammalian chitinase-like n=1 Tax=Ochlerotatus camptorhynchus TaxID=644619 RepID=UPI0031D2B9BC
MVSVKIIGLLLATLVFPTIVAAKNIVCYYGTWATYRNGAGKFSVENIDPFLCTHLIYAFVGISTNGTIRILDPWLDLEDNWGLGTMRKFNDLKTVNPSLKTLVAVGGWNEGSQKFSTVAQNAILRARFAKDAAAFCTNQGFDGLDVDWEYPGQRDGDPSVDRENFVSLLSDLKVEFSKRGLLLTAAVAAAESSASISYNIPEISKYLDFINLMTYDLHGPWESKTGHNAPLYVGPHDVTPTQQQLNVNSSVNYWLQHGAPPAKLNLGVAFYGRSFTLRSAGEHDVGAPTNGPGQGGPYTYESGFLGYNEICEKLTVEKWNQCWDAHQKVPFAYGGNQWVGYDNEESLSQKCDFIYENGLGGGMVWSVETDDFHGTCGEKFTLLNTLNSRLQNNGVITTTTISSSSSSTTATSSTWSTWSSSTAQTTVTPEGSSTTTQQSTTTVSDEFQCVSTGYFRDPKDCTKFYYCDRTTRFEFVCPPGLYFDETTFVCNWAIAVHC